jgi:hypothetical protein
MSNPGTLGYGWHEGSRGEYLAQYFLTALGVSAPVIRQEDVGIDFYCALGWEKDRRLTFRSPYIVQHGAAGSKEFIYGGYSEGKDGKEPKWRGGAIEWLFSQELPLFACTVDRSKAKFRLYSTSAMWLARYQFGQMHMVELCPDANHDPLKESQSQKPVGKVEHGGGYVYRIPLGNPIVDLDVFELETAKREKAIESVAMAIELEQANITFRRLGVHAASWFPAIVPNDPTSLQVRGGSYFWNGTPGKNVPQQIDSLKNIAITLALNLDAQKDTAKLAQLAPVFGLFSKDGIDKWILENLPKVASEHLK